MRILISGNMGYVGSCVTAALRRSYPDAELIGLDAGYFAACLTNAARLPECLLDRQYFGDVRDIPRGALDGTTAVVHLAAISNDPMGNTFESATYEINHQGTVNLARSAREKGVGSFVFACSCSMYGLADDQPRREDSPLNPLTAYAKSKALAERELRGLAGERFLISSLRFATACGMSDRLRLDLVLNDFVACAVSSGRVTILSDGTPWRPLIHVKDMARAITWAVGRDIASGGDFLAVNAGADSWNYQVKDLAYAVAEAIPGTSVSINRDAQPDKRSYRVNFERFRSLAPDHQPTMDLCATIVELRDGLQAMGFRDSDFRNSRLMRLKVLADLRATGLLNERLQWEHRL